MPTKITTGGLGSVIKGILSGVIAVSSRASPNGRFRQPSKSAADVMAAALDTGAPYGAHPKGMYLDGSEPKEPSVEAKDDKDKRSMEGYLGYTGLNDGETVLADWAWTVP